MPKLIDRLPAYQKHRASGQAVVTLDGKDFYLGAHGTKASRREYDRLVGEWVANGRRLPTNGNTPDCTVNEVLAAYLEHAELYYRKADGTPTDEISNIKLAMRFAKHLYGHRPAKDIGPIALKTLRNAMIEANHCRNYINANISRIKRIFRWAAENELITPSVYHGLQAVTGLRRGRSEARESDPVRPVPYAFVQAVLDNVSPQVATMVRLQELTGMRPGEVVVMRSLDIDMSGAIWKYTPESHKTAHHGHQRAIWLGPQAQAILKPWLKPELETYVFSPTEAEANRNAKRRQQRATPLWASHVKHQQKKRKRNPKRAERHRYDVASYRRAITRGVNRANKSISDPDKKIPHWHPHQLRHNAATRLRKEYGIEAARVVLGHRSAAVTEIYAEVDHRKAAEIMLRVG